MMGDLDDILSFDIEDAGTKAGEWIQWLTYISCVAVLVFFTRKV
jgi:hypothetical protein